MPYTSVANLDIHGLTFNTNAGVFIIASQAQPNTTPPPTGNFYSEVPAGGGFGVGQFALSQVPSPIAGAGLPGLIAACGGLVVLVRRRRQPVVIDGVFQAGRCIGLMQGLGFAARLLGVCSPDEVTEAQRARVAITYVEAHPERMHEDFRVLAVEAMQKTWPCK